MMNNKVIEATMVRTPFDLVIKNIKYVNLFTKEVYPADIGISQGKIGYVTLPKEKLELKGLETYDGGGKYALPGLIDTHVHIESSMMTPGHFAKAILPRGTTTIIADPHEIANVLGVKGVTYMLEASEGIPLTVYMLAPSCIPSALNVETSKTAFLGPEIDEIMAHPRVLGLGEVMDFLGVTNQSPRMNEILEHARKFNTFIQGHAPGLTGPMLAAYIAAGIESCHETHTYEEALEKLRSGMVLECRHSSGFKDIPAIAKALIELNYPENATLCTDDREPDDLLKEGHIDDAIRTAIKSGIEPIKAIKMATVNAARLGRVRDKGSLKSGNIADIILVPDLEEFVVDEVFVAGQLIAKNNILVEDFESPTCHIEKQNTLILKKEPTIADFKIHVGDQQEPVRANAIKFNSKDFLFTQLQEVTIPVKSGYLDIEGTEDLATFVNFERHGINGNISIAPVAGLGLKKGAIATTISHDCHNLFVMGKSTEDMLLAVNTLRDSGGGVVCVCDGQIKSLLELPIAGLMSDKSLEELAPQVESIKSCLTDFGIIGPSPLLLIVFFALPVIPEARLTDQGLVEVKTGKIVPICLS